MIEKSLLQKNKGNVSKEELTTALSQVVRLAGVDHFHCCVRQVGLVVRGRDCLYVTASGLAFLFSKVNPEL